MTRARDNSFNPSNNSAAGKNIIINGGMDIWQRGSTFNSITNGGYTADRFYHVWDGSGATRNVSRQEFPTGTSLDGTNPQYFLRYNQSVAGSGGGYNVILAQKVEDVRLFGGQIVTVSFWAKANANTILPTINYWHYLGVGGSGGNLPGNGNYNQVVFGQNTVVTTSWQKFSYTFLMPSLSGDVIGPNAHGYFEIYGPLNTTFTVDFWGLQIERGPLATQFSRAGGDIEGELAKCQRYYQKPQTAFGYLNLTCNYLLAYTNSYSQSVEFAVQMRTSPSITVTDIGGNLNKITGYLSGGNVNNLTPVIQSSPLGFRVYTSGEYRYFEMFNVEASAEI